MLTNRKALKALEVFRSCMNEELDFDLKYAMGRDINFLEPMEKAAKAAMDARSLPGHKEFDADRKAALKQHATGGRLSPESMAVISSELEEKHPVFHAKFKELEEKHEEFLDRELDPSIRIYKIKKGLFPKTFKHDVSALLAFIETGEEDEKFVCIVPDAE